MTIGIIVEIKVSNTEIVKNCFLAKNRLSIVKAERIFIENGYFNNKEEWVYTGHFREVTKYKDQILIDKNINKKGYIKHHNFMVKFKPPF